MPTVVKCPECLDPMKLSDAAAGKRVRCPGCKHIFVAPGAEEEPEVIECNVVEEPVKRPTRRSTRDEEDEDDRPRQKSRREEDDEDDRPRRGRREDEDDRPRRRRRDEDEEDADRRPAKRRRKREDREVTASSTPLILGILSCVFCCIPIIGAILGQMARSKADEEMNRLPGGRRYESAHQQMKLAGLLGTIGITLSVILLFVGLAIRLSNL